MQIKEINISSMDIDNEFAQLIAKNISNDGKVFLENCKLTKPDYETFSLALGDKHVIKMLKSVQITIYKLYQSSKKFFIKPPYFSFTVQVYFVV